MTKTVFYLLLLAPVLSFAQITTIDNAKGAAKEYYDRAIVTRSAYLTDSFATLAVKEKPNFIDAWFALADANVGSSRVDLQACKLEYSIVSPK